jgi:cytidyltransferase-like protein
MVTACNSMLQGVLASPASTCNAAQITLAGTCILTDGCFDPLHPGHVEYFRRAKAIGMPLLCKLTSASYITSHKSRPNLLSDEDRKALLESIAAIDFVEAGCRATFEVLRDSRPAIYAKGTDWLARLPQTQQLQCRLQESLLLFIDCPLNSSTKILDTFVARTHDAARI